MKKKTILFNKSTIKHRVKTLANLIIQDHNRENNSKPPVLICVLNGAFMFYTDVVKHLRHPCEVDFIRVKSYSGKDNSKGVTLTKDIEIDITDRNVYIIEDMLDSGNTLRFLTTHLKTKNPKHIKTVVLLKTKSSNFPVDIHGFTINDSMWVYGYGLDNNGLDRELPALYVQNNP